MFNEMQQVFNRVALHLLQQGKRSLLYASDSSRCAYRSHNGLKCAVGFLISDEAYHYGLESRTVTHELVGKALRKSGVSTAPQMLELLRNLQSIHDNHPAKHWLSQLQLLASFTGLTMPALTAECQPQSEQPIEEVATKEEHAIPELY